MVSKKYLKKLSKILSYQLLNKKEELSVIDLSKIINIHPQTNIILECINRYPNKFILFEKDGIPYIKYNKLETILEENYICTNDYIVEDDLLKLSPLYILSVTYDKYKDIMNKNYNGEQIYYIYDGYRKNLNNHVHIYLQWCHGYCNGIKIKKENNKTLSFNEKDLHTMLKYIYMVLDNDGNRL